MSFVLKQKAPKLQEMTPQKGRGRLCFSPLGHTLGPPFFHPHARVLWFIWYLYFLVKMLQGTKVNVSGGYERLSTNGCVQGLEFCTKTVVGFNALSNAA